MVIIRMQHPQTEPDDFSWRGPWPSLSSPLPSNWTAHTSHRRWPNIINITIIPTIITINNIVIINITIIISLFHFRWCFIHQFKWWAQKIISFTFFTSSCKVPDHFLRKTKSPASWELQKQLAGWFEINRQGGCGNGRGGGGRRLSLCCRTTDLVSQSPPLQLSFSGNLDPWQHLSCSPAIIEPTYVV